MYILCMYIYIYVYLYIHVHVHQLYDFVACASRALASQTNGAWDS